MKLFCSPAGSEVEYEGREVETMTVADALARASPGHVLQLTPGVYEKPIEIRQGGRPKAPLVLRGGEGVVLDGGQAPAAGRPRPPYDAGHFAFIKLLGADWVVLDRLAFENCWPMAIYGESCRDIAIRACRGVGSRFFVFVRNGGLPSPKTKRITLDGCDWVQDPEALMWRGEVSWEQIKDPDDDTFRYFQGALFDSYDIRGDVTIRRCRISHAFNGIVFRAESRELSRRRNINLQVFDNEFDHIRDNAVEPEETAVNLWVYNNKIHNCHGTFSMHHLTGGYWYIFGNSIWFDSRPGKEGQENRGGKIFKFKFGDLPTLPFYVLHNSMYLRSTYIKDGETRNLAHSNNAIQFCFSGEHCEADRKMFSADGTDPSAFKWHESYCFDHDLCNHPDYPDGFAEPDYRLSGIRSERVFADPRRGDLTLVADSPGRGAAKPVEVHLPDGSKVSTSAGIDIGAMQAGGLFDELEYRPLDRRIA